MNISNEFRNYVWTIYGRARTGYECVSEHRVIPITFGVRYTVCANNEKPTLLATCNYRRFSSAKRNRLNQRTAKVIAPVYRPHTISPSIAFDDKAKSNQCLASLCAADGHRQPYTSLSAIRTEMPQLFFWPKCCCCLRSSQVESFGFRYFGKHIGFRIESAGMCLMSVCVCLRARNVGVGKSNRIVISVDRKCGAMHVRRSSTVIAADTE